jgi:hypothetical protein
VADYLTRLAQRTLGVAASPRPDLTAMPWTSSTYIPPTQRSEADTDLSEVESSRAATSSRVGAADPGPARLASLKRPDASLRPVATDVDMNLDAKTSQPSLIGQTTVPAPVSGEGGRRIAASVTALPIFSPASSAAISPVRSAATPDRQDVAVPALREDSSTAPVPPTINVTIGRIEVRAAAQPQISDPAPTRRQRERHLQSLEGYLRQRNAERP